MFLHASACPHVSIYALENPPESCFGVQGNIGTSWEKQQKIGKFLDILEDVWTCRDIEGCIGSNTPKFLVSA